MKSPRWILAHTRTQRESTLYVRCKMTFMAFSPIKLIWWNLNSIHLIIMCETSNSLYVFSWIWIWNLLGFKSVTELVPSLAAYEKLFVRRIKQSVKFLGMKDKHKLIWFFSVWHEFNLVFSCVFYLLANSKGDIFIHFSFKFSHFFCRIHFIWLFSSLTSILPQPTMNMLDFLPQPTSSQNSPFFLFISTYFTSSPIIPRKIITTFSGDLISWELLQKRFQFHKHMS